MLTIVSGVEDGGMTEGCVDPDEAVCWVRPITKFCNGITNHRSLRACPKSRHCSLNLAWKT